MHHRITRVCIVDTVYTLFLYLLISSEEDIAETYFFCSDGIPENIERSLGKNCHHFGPWKEGRFYSRYIRFYLRHFSSYRWPFLRKASLYGHDHLYFSSGLIGNRQITVIEDGIANYRDMETTHSRFSSVESFLYGRLYCSTKFGTSIACRELILTGIKEKKITNNIPIRKISFIDLWNSSSVKKQSQIKGIYDITEDDIRLINGKTNILFTQPYSGLGISEENLIETYRDMIKDCDRNALIIKPHPRETTNYHFYFPDIAVFNKRIPMELLTAMGIRFEKAITICSTAALNFDYKISVDFLGTEILQKYNNKIVKVCLEDFSDNRPIVMTKI